MKTPKANKILYQTAFIAILVVLAGITVLAVYNIIKWTEAPDFGFGFRNATGIKVVGLLREHGRQAGLKEGDRILSVNKMTYDSYLELNAAKNWGPHAKNTYLIERDGRQFEVTITNIPYGYKKTFSTSGLPFIVGLAYTLIGVIVFLMKPYRRTSWVFFIANINFGILLTFLFRVSVLQPYWLDNFIILSYCFFPATMIHLALNFPEERRILKKFSLVQVIPYLVSLFLFISIRMVTPTMVDAPTKALIAVAGYMLFGVLFFLASSAQHRFWSSSEIVKRRARMILLGFAIAALLPVLDFSGTALFHVYLTPGFNVYLPFFIAFPSFIGFAIVKHDLFDIDAIIKRTYGYVLTTGSIAGIYGLFVLISNLAFGSFDFAKSPVFPLIFLLAIVFLFNPIRNRVQKIIDRLFYRLEYNYQETVQNISESMRTLLGLDEIGKNIMETALGTMFIDSGSVMLRKKDANEYRCLIQAGETDEAIRNSGTGQYLANDTNRDDTTQQEEKALGGLSTQMPSDLTLDVDDPLIQKIAERKKEVIIYDIQEDPFFEDHRESCEQVFDRLDATLIVPLIYEDKLSGLISLGRKKSGKFYRREDINLLNILANQGAVAIENAMMLEEVIEKERMEEELNIAQDLQVSMLPAACPEIDGFELAAYSASAREVGGDFYDFIEIDAGKSGIVIGDVTGKSVSGALVMSASRSIFRMLGEEELTVSESMNRANRRTKKDIKSGMFVALLYAVLSAENKSLSLCSAGQTQPVYLSAATGEATLVETKGDTFPLGILDEALYEETRLQMESGDRIILYTDGVVEAMNEQEELFGFDRLLEVVKNSQTTTAETLLEEIKGQVNEFAGSAPQHDDITVIVIQAD
jgi:serine phosphatase RsbU (regulator of sigma subunit)